MPKRLRRVTISDRNRDTMIKQLREGHGLYSHIKPAMSFTLVDFQSDARETESITRFVFCTCMTKEFHWENVRKANQTHERESAVG